MLDKSLPYYNIIMKRKSGTYCPIATLPEGFTFTRYKAGDEKTWAEMLNSVLEFDSEEEALSYFQEYYMIHEDKLRERLIFIENSGGEKVASMINWWNEHEGTVWPSMHWIAVKPEYQGLGLGKAVVYEGVRQQIQLDGDLDFFLHTQTWSWKAVNIYLTAGYQIEAVESFSGYPNEYSKAMAVIKDKLKYK